MRYKDLCSQMHAAGWLSHTIAACNTDHHEGSGQKHFTAKRLLDTKTGQAFLASQPVPTFDAASGVFASLRFHDEHGWHDDPVSIDRPNNLLLLIHSGDGRRLIAFLSDIPSSRITYTAASPAPVPPISAPPSIAVEIDEFSAREGAVSIRQHLHRERDPALVAAKRRQVVAATGRLSCCVCAFDFLDFYGEHGTGFCEVHHLRPLGETDGEVETRLEDLAVVCANCHRMLHRSDPFLTLEQLKSKIRNA